MYEAGHKPPAWIRYNSQHQRASPFKDVVSVCRRYNKLFMDANGPSLTALGTAAGLGAAFMAWAVRGRSSQVFGPSLWRGSPGRRALALTFDDGPGEDTPRLLEILERHSVPATFFQIGLNVRRLPHVARAVSEAGHAIGNHTFSHPMFCNPRFGFPPRRWIEHELCLAQEVIREHTGTIPVWFRAPYGVRWFGLRPALRRLRLTGVMWTVIGYDWKRTGRGGPAAAQAIAVRVASKVSSGAILCFHDGRELCVRPDIGVTLEAVRRLVPLLLDWGYQFESLDNLLCPPKN
jgi:peptidoglycan-N-acetylglucosamine deacetylase